MEDVPLNVKLQQQNLIHVCRLIIKSLLDKACRESVIEEGCRELHNLLAVIEHILMFQIKAHQSWYGAVETRWFWDYIKVACKDFPNNCIHSIESLANARTPRGKGRGWLRLALMEKKLADYLTHAIQQKDLTKSMYQPGAIVMGEEAAIFVGNLVGLNAIDFSFDVKSASLDRDTRYVIDHTPYLTFNHNLNDQPSFFKDITSTSRKSEDQLQVLMDQKGYFEELVKLREDQLVESNQEKAELLESLQRCQEDSRKQKQQLESIIIELQTQLALTRQQHSRQVRSLQRAFDSSSDPNAKSLPMIEITAPTPTATEAPDTFPRCSVGVQTELRYILMSETKSVISLASTTSLGKEENPSIVPLTGSLSSQSGTGVFLDTSDSVLDSHTDFTKSSEYSPHSDESCPSAEKHMEGQGHRDMSLSEGHVRTARSISASSTKSESSNSNKRAMTDVTGEKSPPSKVTLLSEDAMEHTQDVQSEPSESDYHMVSSASSTESNNGKNKDKADSENCPDSVTLREHSMSPDYELVSPPSSESDSSELLEKVKDDTSLPEEKHADLTEALEGEEKHN